MHNQQGMPQGTQQSQTPNNAQQPLSASAITPQTPTFPSTGQGLNMNGNTATATPLSPSSGAREKERFDLLLTINQELLYESIQLQNTRSELRREQSAAAEAEGGINGDGTDIAEEEKLIQLDYAQ